MIKKNVGGGYLHMQSSYTLACVCVYVCVGYYWQNNHYTELCSYFYVKKKNIFSFSWENAFVVLAQPYVGDCK